MKRHSWLRPAFVGAALALPLFAMRAHASEPGSTPADTGAATLKYHAVSDWDIILPEQRWEPIATHGTIEIGTGFATEKSGVMSFRLDTNGNGQTDTKVKGTESFVKLRGVNPDGERFNYAIRVVYQGTRFEWASSNMLLGQIAGTTFKVIDQNNNGVFGEIGEDAMIVGKSRGASMLSRIVNVGGDLFELEFSDNGRKVTYTPWDGDSGKLDVTSKYDCRGKLISAVFESADGKVSFNAARSNKPIRVPAGEYRLVSGFAAKGAETVEMVGGKMGPVQVRAREEKVLDWGGPIVAEFDYEVDDDTITVDAGVAFYGGAGEEYTRFQPNAKSPKIIVLDSKTRKEVASGRFGGC